jgi:hypothetical protein
MKWFSTRRSERVARLGGWTVRYRRQAADGAMGRFGGGWNWALGFRLGGSTLLLDLLVVSVTIARAPKEAV